MHNKALNDLKSKTLTHSIATKPQSREDRRSCRLLMRPLCFGVDDVFSAIIIYTPTNKILLMKFDGIFYSITIRGQGF